METVEARRCSDGRASPDHGRSAGETKIVEQVRARNAHVSSKSLKPIDPTEAMPKAPAGEPNTIANFKRSMLSPRHKKELVRLLGKTFIFAGTREDFRERICDEVWPVVYAQGQEVFHNGDRGDWMALCISGKLQRTIDRSSDLRSLEIDVGTIGAGAIIGDIGLFGINPRRSFTVKAETEVTVLILTRDVLRMCVDEQRFKGNQEGKSVQMFAEAEEMGGLMADMNQFLELDCFRGLDPEFIMSLRDHSEPRLIYPNQVLMRENNYGNEMYVIRSGKVHIEKGGKWIMQLDHGVVLGELAVLGSDKRRMATVMSDSLCLIRVIHGDDFHSLIKNFPKARRVFDHRYIARLVTINLRNVTEERTHLDDFYGSAAPRTTQEIAELLGTAEEKSSSPKKLQALPPIAK